MQDKGWRDEGQGDGIAGMRVSVIRSGGMRVSRMRVNGMGTPADEGQQDKGLAG